MDNNHVTPTTNNTANSHHNNSITHSVTEIGDRLNMLTVNDQLNASSRSLPSNNYVDISSMHNLASRSSSSPNNTLVAAQTAPSQTFSKLNPSAQEFVPRNFTNRPTPTTGNYHQIRAPILPNAPLSNNNNHHYNHNSHHSYANGGSGGGGGPAANNNQSSANPTTAPNDNENYIEDYISLSYLKDFINHISNKPSMYEQGINELTSIINAYLDEDDCVLELIVNQIVDQSIIDVNFRYNGVRLCNHFMEKLRKTNSGQSFKQLLFKRNQRECSRRVTDITSANTIEHLRGLALFSADLYSRCKDKELVEHLPSLLMNIISSDIRRDENVKCVYQVLMLCGQQMEQYFASNGKQDFTNLVDKLRETLKCDMTSQTKDMVNKVLNLVENDWIPPQQTVQSNLVNPYLNNDYDNGQYANNNSCELYDFGNCGDENNAEVCQDFENFLKSTQQN